MPAASLEPGPLLPALEHGHSPPYPDGGMHSSRPGRDHLSPAKRQSLYRRDSVWAAYGSRASP